jgi:hypothetical protein
MSQTDTTAKARPANPYSRQVAELRLELLTRCTPERLGKIADRMMELAEEGDVSAAKLIFQYVLGKPHEAVSPDRVDIDEVETFRDGACKKDVLLPTLLGGVPADVSADLLRQLTPVMGDLACAEFRTLGDVLRAEEAEQAPPTVNKRVSQAQSAPAGDSSDKAPAEAELIRLINSTVTKRARTDQRAANPPRP